MRTSRTMDVKGDAIRMWMCAGVLAAALTCMSRPSDAIGAEAMLPPVPATFVHPGLLSTTGELQFVKNKIAAGEAPWAAAFKALKQSKWADLNYKAKPQAFCDRGGPQNDDAQAAYAHALMWVYTRDERYARKAAEILNGWSIQTGGESDNWYLLGTATIFAEAAELLKSTYPGWDAAESKTFATMLSRVYLPVLHNQAAYGSKAFSVIYAMMAIAVVCDDRGAFLEAVSRFERYLPCWIYLKEDGPKPRMADLARLVPPDGELAKLDAALFPNPADAWFAVKGKAGPDDRALLQSGDLERLWNGAPPSAFVDGLCAQTFNGKGGLGDCDAGFVGLSHAAEVAWHQGVDLYTPNAKRITAFMELCSRLRLADDVPPDYYRLMPGSMTATWEVGYNHYHNRKGIELPWTERLIQKAVRSCLAKTPRTSTGWSYVRAEPCGLRAVSMLYPALQNCAWETLTHAEVGGVGRP